MRKRSVKSSAWAFFALFLGLSLLIASLPRLSAQTTPQQHDKTSSELPTLNYESEINKSVGEDQRKTAVRFNGHYVDPGMLERRRITEMPPGARPLPSNIHWWQGMAALPTKNSDVIIVGKVVDSQAHMSEDRTGVYSQYSIVVSETFKNTGKALGSIITGTRPGGAVRFASGKVQEYSIADLGFPRKGSTYVLFLRREDAGDFTILTGYEVLNGIVSPLDDVQGLPFASYKDAVESNLIRDLRSAIDQDKGGEK